MTWAFGVALAGDGTSLLLMDRAAREAGVGVLAEDVELDATLPVQLERDVALVVALDEDERNLWVEEGLVYVVTGEEGKVRATRPGVNVDPDAVRVIAERAVVEALAADVDAQWAVDGDGYELRAPGLLASMAHAPIPEEDLDLELVPLARPLGRAPKQYATSRPPRLRPKQVERRVIAARGLYAPTIVPSLDPVLAAHRAQSPSRAARPANLVGWYCFATDCIVLGIDGLAHRCVDASCREAGPWWATDDGLRVGDAAYTWQDGRLAPAAGAR